MMGKALGGGGGPQGTKENRMGKEQTLGNIAPGMINPHGNELAKQLGFRQAWDKRARVEVAKGPEGPLVYLDSKDQQRHEAEHFDRSDDESDLSDLSDAGDSDLNRIREARMAELKSQFQSNQRFLALGHGEYSEVHQDEFLPAVTASKYVLCHFYHEEFTRCKIIDRHFAYLAGIHLPTRFIKIDATKSPFFVAKLKIKTLPTIVCFKDGKSVDRVVGFEDLGNTDEFTSFTLAARLAMSGCLILEKQIQMNLEEDMDELED